MTYRCQYDVRLSGGGCPNERTLDFEFCQVHLNTPRGKQHVMDIIARGSITTPSQVEAVVQQAQELPDENYQVSALEKMIRVHDRLQDWADETRRNLEALGDPANWRYKDRAQQEQTRAEVGAYERALATLSRHTSSMAKIALQDKLVTLGKAQIDLMIRLMLSTINELRLDNRTTDQAKMILFKKLENEANLDPRVESHASSQLAIDSASGTVADPSMTGGVTGVSVRGERIA